MGKSNKKETGIVSVTLKGPAADLIPMMTKLKKNTDINQSLACPGAITLSGQCSRY